MARALALLVAGSLLLSLALAAPAASSLAGAQWAAHTAQTAALKLGSGSTAGEALGGALDYQYSMPLANVQGSNVYTAGNARYRRVVQSLRDGKEVKVVAIGGVATNGSDASASTRDYFSRYVNFLARAFPGAKISAVRSSVGVAPSAVLAQCMDTYLPGDADLVLLEMTANDGRAMDNSILNGHNAKAYELVMRKILQAPNQPALILTQSMVRGMGNGNTPFYRTPEAPQYAALASYYGTPVVSMRNVVWPSATPNANSLVVSTATNRSDGSTPNDLGHAGMTDMLVYNTQRTAMDLQLLPYGEYDRNALANDVPERPVYGEVAGNPANVIANSTCQWLRNVSAPAERGCPTKMAQMCGLDYSSEPAFLASFDAKVDLSPEKSNLPMLIGVIVGSVVGGLLLIAACLACCIVKRKRHQAKIAAQAEARAAARKAAAAAGGAGPGAVPISASAGSGAASGKSVV